jgi:hypothetical protein
VTPPAQPPYLPQTPQTVGPPIPYRIEERRRTIFITSSVPPGKWDSKALGELLNIPEIPEESDSLTQRQRRAKSLNESELIVLRIIRISNPRTRPLILLAPFAKVLVFQRVEGRPPRPLRLQLPSAGRHEPLLVIESYSITGTILIMASRIFLLILWCSMERDTPPASICFSRSKYVHLCVFMIVESLNSYLVSRASPKSCRAYSNLFRETECRLFTGTPISTRSPTRLDECEHSKGA